MGIALDDAEALIEEAYARAGVRDEQAVCFPAELIRRRFGEDAIAIVHGLKQRASVGIVNGKPVFAVRASLSREERRFCLGHELAHIVCNEAGYLGDDIETVCDFIGAGIQTRARPFLRRARAYGAKFEPLAVEFGTTQTWAALRYGETTGAPTAVIGPKSVRVRGSAWEWGSVENVRRIAKCGAEGVERKQLTDDRRRTVLLCG